MKLRRQISPTHIDGQFSQVGVQDTGARIVSFSLLG